MTDRPIYSVSKEMQTGRENKRGGKGPRRSGDRVERMVAKEIGGSRNPGSGAFKNTNKDLTGDVSVNDADNKPLMKIEVKACGTLNTKGEKSYALSKAVLDQMVKEAEDGNQLGSLFLHFKGESLDDGYAIMLVRHWKQLLELAKLGATLVK